MVLTQVLNDQKSSTLEEHLSPMDGFLENCEENTKIQKQIDEAIEKSISRE